MRRSKEIIVLLALLIGAMIFVLWYVIDRRAKNRAVTPATHGHAVAPEAPSALAPLPGEQSPAAKPAGSHTALTPASPKRTPASPVAAAPGDDAVVLGTATTERKTIDFSNGKAVVKDSIEDKAAIDAAMKDIAEASQSVSFDDPPKRAAQPAATK